MEFCPHCGLHLQGHRDYCRNCGPDVCWWFGNHEIVEQLGLEEEESWRDENGQAHSRGWELKEDGKYHPFSWTRSRLDGRFYPHDWRLDETGVYAPQKIEMA